MSTVPSIVSDGTGSATMAHEIYLSERARGIAPVRLTGNYGSEVFRRVSTYKPIGLDPSLLAGDFLAGPAARGPRRRPDGRPEIGGIPRGALPSGRVTCDRSVALDPENAVSGQRVGRSRTAGLASLPRGIQVPRFGSCARAGPSLRRSPRTGGCDGRTGTRSSGAAGLVGGTVQARLSACRGDQPRVARTRPSRGAGHRTSRSLHAASVPGVSAVVPGQAGRVCPRRRPGAVG